VARYLEGIRRFHTGDRGWSDIAYQEAVDQRGRRWDLRGWHRASAANGSTEANDRWGAVVALIGQGQKPTPAMLRGLDAAHRDFVRVHPTGRRLVTHNDVRPQPTACPGPHLTRWVARGGYVPAPTPEELISMELSDTITIPGTYASNQDRRDGKGEDSRPEEITVETLLRRMYDWTYRNTFGG
jgi:hypothetical protein